MKRLWRFASLSLLFLGWGLLLFLFGRYWTQQQYSESSQVCLSQDSESSPTLQPVTENAPDEVQASPAPAPTPVPQIVTQPVQQPQTNQGGADVETVSVPEVDTQETQSAPSQSEESVEVPEAAPEEPRRKRR